MKPTPVEEIIQGVSERWQDCEGLPEMTLLRLAILRELIQMLHSAKSRCLAGGLKTEALDIKRWEVRIEEIKDSAILQGSLPQLLQQSSPSTPTLSKKKRNIPESLFTSFDRDKVLRYDRKWEAAILAEALSLNWKVWALDAWVNIPQIEEWDRAFTQRLWPHGLILITENAKSSQDSQSSSTDSDSHCWQGRWTILLHPHFKHITELSLQLDRWPGSPEKPPSPPAWKRIYP
jgi:hypothetical protein